MSFDVTTAGTYNLEIGAADRGSNDWISPVKVTINGEDYGFLWNADNTADGFTRAVRGYTARGSYNFNKYQTKTPVKLSEGENTIVFTGYSAQDNSWNNNGTQQKVGAGDNVSAGVDYVAFSKFAARKITDGDTVELEEFINLNNGFGTAKADALSDGVAATVEKYNPDGEKTYSFSVDADAAGDYYLTAGIADRGAGDWQSAVKLTVNGTDVGYFRNSDYTEDAFACAAVKYAKSGNYTFNKYVSKAPVALNEGDNEFVFTVYDANQNSFNGNSTGTASQLFAGLDYMTFNKARNISNVTMTVADTLAVGGVSEIVLKDGDGNVITASDVAQITYSSSLENVATVTAEAKVTGVKPGRTKISAEILVNAGDSETISASAWVNVVDDDIFIANVQISEDGKITFDVVNNTDFDDYENIKAIAASYMDGTMKSIADFSIESLLCGTSSACEMTLSGYEDGDDVYIYVWDGLGTMIPVMAEKKQY